MEKGKIIIIGSGRNYDIERKIYEIMKLSSEVPILIATTGNPIGSPFAQERPEGLIDMDWEAVKDLRFNQRIQPTMTQIKYLNLIYNEPKSKFHK
jgi:hypothetical protein